MSGLFAGGPVLSKAAMEHLGVGFCVALPSSLGCPAVWLFEEKTVAKPCSRAAAWVC